MATVDKPREELLRDLVREVRQFNGLGASFFRTAAGRISMNATDAQVIDTLDVTGPTTAGQLAELTGLTTGAITQMLDRLESDGIVRRERDPEDGRRVIVRLTPSADTMGKIGPIFASVEERWRHITSDYDDEQLAFLLAFLKRSNQTSREEIAWLRETPEVAATDFAAPLRGLESARLAFSVGAVGVILHGETGMDDLYRARFEGTVPDVKVKDGTVTIRYPRRAQFLAWRKRSAEVTLNAAIPWVITLQGGAADVNADLSALELAGLEYKGGVASLQLTLPKPSGVVPIRISGAAAAYIFRRPAGVAACIHLKGWSTQLVFDDQSYMNAGNDLRLQSSNYDGATSRYDIEIAASVSSITFTEE
jgi:DNA-binding MarR family transcriptional regulator